MNDAAETCSDALQPGQDRDRLHALAYAAHQAGRHDEAVAYGGQAARLGLQDWGLFLILGHSRSAQGLHDEALDYARRAYRLSPAQADVLLLQETLAVEGPEAVEALYLALADIGQAAEARQGWAKQLVFLAQVQANAGRVEVAERFGRLALAARADDAALHSLLAYLAHMAGRHEAAVGHYEKAAALGQEDWASLMALAHDLSALDRDEEALEALARARRLEPARADVAFALLEKTLSVRGSGEARACYDALRESAASPDLEGRWRDLLFDHLPPEVDRLLCEGWLDEAEAACRAAIAGLGSRRAQLTLENIGTYRSWLAFTARPDRKPKVSVLLITYNHGRYVGQALDSVLSQRTDYEIDILVVDDCSPDDTQAVVLEYQKRHPNIIRTAFNPTNVGTLDPPQQKVTHAAFSQLTGDYVAILEGDDYWSSPDKIQKQVSFLEANPGYAACSHNTVKIYEGGATPSHRFQYWPGQPPSHTIDGAVAMTTFFHVSSMLYRNVLQGRPMKQFASKWSCDIFMTMAHVRHGRLRFFDEDMSVYRAHAGGSYSNMGLQKSLIYSLEGLLRFNLWLGLRYAKGFAFSIHRLSRTLLKEAREGILPGLAPAQERRYRAIAAASGTVYDLIDRFPRLDPAVFWYKEPCKPSEPRRRKLAEFGLS